MSGREKILDDVARMAGGAVNVLSGLQQQIRDEVRSYLEDFAARMDLVPREDVDKLEAMLAKTREELEAQNERLTALEKTLKK
ncbi:MAG: accessory factor UbiK family protein [Alphaproteobacteria bacterium]|nr:accessory factor UbiK family protein [Alphaproteobacteria bacterium]